MTTTPTYHKWLLFILFICLNSIQIEAQSNRKALEKKRLNLKKEIHDIKRYLDKTKKKEVNLSSNMRSLQKKITTRKAILNNLEDEIKEIEKSLTTNEQELETLKKELETLKKDYAELVYKSYKNRLSENQLLFIFSAKSFYQGYLRLQYLKQFSMYRKEQGQKIILQTKRLENINDRISIKKHEKETLLKDMNQEQQEMSKEKKSQEELIAKYKKKKRDYQKKIKTKQKEERKLTAQIENLIKSAIKQSTKNNNNTFKLTPAAKQLAKNFESNKGKLPWPVDRGVVTVKFGKQPDPFDPKIQIESSGVRIATEENTMVRSIFKGKVIGIQKNPQNGVLSVLIQHGNYISVYSNLKRVSVSKGESVVTKQRIGWVYTNPVTDQSILKFQIWKNINKQNPAHWIKGM